MLERSPRGPCLSILKDFSKVPPHGVDRLRHGHCGGPVACCVECRRQDSRRQARDLRPRPNATLIKALTRAHRWKERLFTGGAPSTSAIANEEGVTERYVSRIMRLAFLAPDIVEAILDGHQPADLELERLMKGVPVSWNEQRRALGFSRGRLPQQL